MKTFCKLLEQAARVCPNPPAQSNASRIFYAAIPKQWITITRLSGASVSKYSTHYYRLLSKYQTKPNLSCSNPLGQCKERKRLAFTASSKCNGQSFEPRQVRSERSLDIDNWSWGIMDPHLSPLDNNFPPFVWSSDNTRQRKRDGGLSQGQWRYWRWVIVPIVTNDD